jgi:HD-GYP domain-containing protein (c-di-GMP phosphodiesterase class II)
MDHLSVIRQGPDEAAFRLSEIIAALSHALDMTEGQPIGHATRTCLLGMRVGEQIGLAQHEAGALFYALLLKDAGCSSSSARMCELFGTDDIALKTAAKTVNFQRPSEALRYMVQNVAGDSRLARARKTLHVSARLAAEGREIVATRCDRGASVLAMLDFPPAAASAVRALDEHWDGRGLPDGIAGDAIPMLGRIACLAQTAEVFFTTYGLESARDMVRARRGSWFDPQLADAFLALPDSDPVWAKLAHDEHADRVLELEPDDHALIADESRLDRVAQAFAGIVDAKSPYTARHSEGVAAYAVAVAERIGAGQAAIREVWRCGLLHDIGKLGISNSILDKPAKLDDAEFADIRRHPALTAQILGRVPAFALLSADAAAHHERLDGRGYHLGLAGADVTPIARILAVADVYEALTADRPYRAAMSRDEALAIMRRDVGSAFAPDALAALEDATQTGLLLAA